MNLDPTIVGALVVGLVLVILAGRSLFGSARRYGVGLTEQEVEQLRIEQLARGTDEERWLAEGASARRASGMGCIGKLILLGILLIVGLAIFDVVVGNGEVLRGILGR